jgi:hypothetical protein
MSIEINELIVNATIDDGPGTNANNEKNRNDLYLGIEEIKSQIISECKDLFHELLDKRGDR